MSNKDLLKLENEYIDELPKYKEKPKIGPVAKPTHLTSKLTEFLASASKKSEEQNGAKGEAKQDGSNHGKQVEMDIYITPTTE